MALTIFVTPLLRPESLPRFGFPADPYLETSLMSSSSRFRKSAEGVFARTICAHVARAVFFCARTVNSSVIYHTPPAPQFAGMFLTLSLPWLAPTRSDTSWQSTDADEQGIGRTARRLQLRISSSPDLSPCHAVLLGSRGTIYFRASFPVLPSQSLLMRQHRFLFNAPAPRIAAIGPQTCNMSPCPRDPLGPDRS